MFVPSWGKINVKMAYWHPQEVLTAHGDILQMSMGKEQDFSPKPNIKFTDQNKLLKKQSAFLNAKASGIKCSFIEEIKINRPPLSRNYQAI